jgi:hypothetical protein
VTKHVSAVAPTNAIQHGSTLSKKIPPKPFFVKGFGDGGVGEGPFIKRAFPHKRKIKK